ncbi:SdpA family antimicrobial peptide system protein [Mycetocola reblochoni]|nr:SdpA family antimicrobial peptide system protein [Mycetocola reblochoni]
MSGANGTSHGGVRTKFGVVCAIAAVAVAAIVFSSLPIKSHASEAARAMTGLVNEISPQGWGFFTKDPREPFMVAYVMNEHGAWEHVTRGPNARPQNAFGLNRESRLDEYDHSQLIGTAELDDVWAECTGDDVDGCATAAMDSQGTQEWQVSGYDLRLCGDVLLLKREPIPLDYAGLDYDPTSWAIRADVACTVQEQA